MESTFNVGELNSCDEPNNINNNDIQCVEFIDQWPVDTGSCDGDDIIREFLNNWETSSSVEPNIVCGDDDCMILDGDPDKPIVVAVDEKIESDDMLIVKEKGQVACRDFPHARHSCANFPFSTTSHEQYCKMCYCFVCDSPAPCKFWSNNPGGHCHASDNFESWISLRKKHKDAIISTNKAIAPTQRQAPNVPSSSNPDCPHFRHSCGNFPFDITSHEQHCKMCHCFVCDSPAPCKFWSNNPGGHCHASDKFESWISLRKKHKDAIVSTNKAIAPTPRQAPSVPSSSNPDCPHFRHSCGNFPFDITSHEQHCKMCHCFVCDSPAPCKFWSNNPGGHCHASDKFESSTPLRKKHMDATVDTNKAIAPTRRQAPYVPNSSSPNFPHFRHSCGNFPFDTTSHEQHCKMCHCFVCDSPAPCRFWTHAHSRGHCHASDKFESWANLRKMHKEANATQVPNAFSGRAGLYQQPVLNTQYMINTNSISHIQTRAHPKSKRQPYSNAPSNVKRYLGPPSVHQTQFKRHGTTPGYVSASSGQALQTLPSDEDIKKFWVKLAAIADELEVSECSNKHGSES